MIHHSARSKYSEFRVGITFNLKDFSRQFNHLMQWDYIILSSSETEECQADEEAAEEAGEDGGLARKKRYALYSRKWKAKEME